MSGSDITDRVATARRRAAGVAGSGTPAVLGEKDLERVQGGASDTAVLAAEDDGARQSYHRPKAFQIVSAGGD